MSGRVVAVVPTVGRSPWLGDCLRALLAQPGMAEVVVVAQGAVEVPILAGVCLERVERPLGFAAAVDRGLREAGGATAVAVVNDDAVVGEGWLEALAGELAAPGVGSAQGVVLLPGEPPRLDGAGLAWNRWWQAVQRGRGEMPPPRGESPREVFGVSATAALYRREALVSVAREDGTVFDPILETYYEDVDLAARLRAGGWTARLVPAAVARHLGGASEAEVGRRRRALLVGNRLLVLARLLGPALLPRLPRVLARDLFDVARRPSLAPGTLAGWARAARHLRRFVRRLPLLPLAALAPFRER